MLHFFDSLRPSLTRDDPSAFAAPAQFGPFRVLHQIGVGALGPVFRTYEPDRDRLVAVKAFRVDLTPEQARALADELSHVAAAGLFHPSIVEPIAAGVEGTLAYNAEEYVAAESLDVAMRHYAPAAIDTVLPFLTQLAGAIDFARAAGVGHGAIHPRDIFMTPDEARITGFGIVEALERVGFRAPVRRPYSPPERIAGDEWSTPADVFSLAAVAFELLTARRPAGLGSEIGLMTPGGVDASASALHAVLARAMDEDPSRRYATALAFASALEAAAHGRSVSGTGVSAPALAVPAAAAFAPETSRAADAPRSSETRQPDAVVARPVEPEEEFASEADVAADVEGDLEGHVLDDDIVVEREEDAAHHLFALEEADAAAKRETLPGRGPAAAMDADSEIEAEADRFGRDDFLLDAAGAAAASASRSGDFRPTGAGRLDFTARERVDEPEPQEEPEEVEPRYEPALVESGEHASSRLTFALVLLLGVLGGFVGGYVMWGRSSPPSSTDARDTTDQVVTTPARRPAAEAPAAPGAATTNAPTNAPTAATPTTGVADRPAAAPPPAVREKPQPKPQARVPAPAAAPRAAGGRGSSPARTPNGTIVVRSTPIGAVVTLNGRWRGRTPLALENLPLTRHEVRIVQPGFAPAEQVVTLSAADPDRTLAIRLQPTTPGAAPAARPEASRPGAAAGTGFMGSVFVDSRPRGAKVFIDGKEVGTTPLSVPEVRIGTHVVRLELPDHRTWASTTTVTSGQLSRVTGSLERIQ